MWAEVAETPRTEVGPEVELRRRPRLLLRPTARPDLVPPDIDGDNKVRPEIVGPARPLGGLLVGAPVRGRLGVYSLDGPEVRVGDVGVARASVRRVLGTDGTLRQTVVETEGDVDDGALQAAVVIGRPRVGAEGDAGVAVGETAIITKEDVGHEVPKGMTQEGVARVGRPGDVTPVTV